MTVVDPLRCSECGAHGATVITPKGCFACGAVQPTPSDAASIPDEVVMRCATCGKEKPNDAAWARPATCCGESRWTGSVTFSQTPDGVVAHGDIRYGIEVPDA